MTRMTSGMMMMMMMMMIIIIIIINVTKSFETSLEGKDTTLWNQ